MAEKNVEVIDKESKQYIVVMVGSEQYGIDTAILTTSCVCRRLPVSRRSSPTLRA